MVASALASNNRPAARAIIIRLAQLGCASGIVMATGLSFGFAHIPALFTPDPAVAKAVTAVLPLVIITMPVDGAEKPIEGTLLAAGEVRMVLPHVACQ